MTDIPGDVMKAAADVCEDVWHAWHDDEGNSVEGDPTAIIARAILAERERCAAVAKAMLVYADTTSGADEAIPAAIMDPDHWLAKNPARAP